MCGILGYVGEGCDDAVFERALSTMFHRGPDGFGISKHKDIVLGHRRLSIIDLSDNGKQPMELYGRYVITFNGEIYNYKEIKEQLSATGITFKSDSDTEVLLQAYIKWGSACLHKFNGMWSFAIWDKENQSLFIARDRIGKKPFFYSNIPGRFIFSSEMKGIYPFLNKMQINYELAQFAIEHPFDYEITSECLIKDINRFPAGSYGVYTFKDGLKIIKYWDVLNERRTDVPKSYEEQVELFRELFLDSCKIRMRSDVTIGTALSGGLDSSTVICSMDYLTKKGYQGIQKNFQHAFIASFPGTSIDETEYAKAVTDSLNVKANFVEINPLLELDDIYRQTYLFEEIYYAPTIPFVQLYRNLREHNVTVSIDGHGADELFAGYPFDITNAIPDSLPNINQFLNIVKTINSCSLNSSNYTNLISFLKFGILNKYPSIIKLLKNKEQVELLNKIDKLGFLDSKLYTSTFQTILPTLLRNYDRYSMINGVEIRMPFLDYRIIEFAFSIPYTSKVRNGYTKAIVRDAFKDIVPSKITNRKAKIGFNSPMNSWMNGVMKEWIKDIVHSDSFKSCSLINSEAVKKNVLQVIDKKELSYAEGEKSFAKLMPYVWEKSLNYAHGK